MSDLSKEEQLAGELQQLVSRRLIDGDFGVRTLEKYLEHMHQRVRQRRVATYHWMQEIGTVMEIHEVVEKLTVRDMWPCVHCRKGKHQHLDSKCPFDSALYLAMDADDMHTFVDEHLSEAIAWLTQP